MIRIQNQASHPFSGWKRLTVSRWPTWDSGVVGGCQFVLGRHLGTAARVCDVRVSLQPGQAVVLDLMQSEARPYVIHDHVPAQAVADPVSYFGIPHVLNAPLEFVSMREDGACFLIHLRGRSHLAPLLVSDLFVHWYPDQTWAPAALSVTASNPAIPDLQATLPTSLNLEITGATVTYPNGGNGPLMPAGDWFGDGQTRAWPCAIYWPRGADSADVLYADASARQEIAGRGLSQIGPLGVIAEQGRFDARAWINRFRTPARNALFQWPSVWDLGVAMNSGVGGDQEDQGYSQGFECFYPGGLGAEFPTLNAAYAQMRRPCHYREKDGSLLDLDTHPGLKMWALRPHSNGTDWLGKPPRTAFDAHGYNGPDAEHHWMNRVAAAFELTGCPVLEQELESIARALMFEQWLTTARENGCRGMVIAHLFRLLPNRVLANRLRDRWCRFVENTLVPLWRDKPMWDYRDSRTPSLALYVDETQYPKVCMAYQSALGAYGVWLAGKVLEHEPSRVLGAQCAKDVIEHCYIGFEEWAQIGVGPDGKLARPPFLMGFNAWDNGDYRFKWFPLAVYVAAVEGHDKAADLHGWLMAQLKSYMPVNRAVLDGLATDWLPPLPATS